MANSISRALATIGTILAAFILMQVMALPAYADAVVLAVDTANHGSNVTIECATGDDLAEAIERGYLASLEQDAGDYYFEGDKLCAIAVKPASAYVDEGELASDSVYSNGWLDTYNWGEVDGDRTFYAVWESDFGVDPAGLHHHVWKYSDFAIKKASFTEGGYAYNECTLCGKQEYAMPWPRVDVCKLAVASCVYNGKAQKPKVTISSADGPLSSDSYSVTYSKNTNVGTASAKVTLKGKYYEGAKTLTFKITQAANPLAGKAKTATVKYSKVKKKAQPLAVSKVVKFTKKGQGTVTYAKKSGNKKISINKKTGKVTVKKGLKKGTYKVTVAIKAAGNANYKAKTIKVTFKVKVK